MEKDIYLLPIGVVEEPLLEAVAQELEAIFRRPCRIGEGLPDPTYAYDGRRKQYRVEAIMARLRLLDLPRAHRLLGLVDRDCYTPGLNFIFGQAIIGGREAIVALPRLRQGFYGLPEDQVLFHERTVKEAVHELGHTYGLRHCGDPRCVMCFSNSLADTDAKGASFCPACRGELVEVLKNL